MHKTTEKLIEKLGIAVTFSEVSEAEAEEKEMVEGSYVEIYANAEDDEYDVSYRILANGDYQYHNAITGEDYPALIQGEVAFRNFLKEFKKVYG